MANEFTEAQIRAAATSLQNDLNAIVRDGAPMKPWPDDVRSQYIEVTKRMFAAASTAAPEAVFPTTVFVTSQAQADAMFGPDAAYSNLRVQADREDWSDAPSELAIEGFGVLWVFNPEDVPHAR